MRDVLGPGTILGYCTNVHAGTTLDAIKSNLDQHALPVKRRVSPDRPMGVGLWFPADAAVELIEDHRMGEMRAFLDARGLLPFTLNGFPFSDFHTDSVKHAVYQPNWSHHDRAGYTKYLAVILDSLLDPGDVGSISTLPLGWRGDVDPDWVHTLIDVIDFLAKLEGETGRLVHLDLEPEPGCELDTVADLARTLAAIETITDIKPDTLRRYLRVCLDVCHQAVMFEGPTRVLDWCRESGMKIGKVQVSSGLRILYRGRSPKTKQHMRDELEKFVEPRYLHQTTIGRANDRPLVEFYDDLPDALQARPTNSYEWRVHFHVPVHLDSIGHLDTTQDAITALLEHIEPEDEIHHFEVETYAWDVLPASLQPIELAAGIAEELNWVKNLASP